MITVKINVKSALKKGIKSIFDLTESLPGKNLDNDLICKVRRNRLIPGTTIFPIMDEIRSFAANAIIIAEAKPTTLFSFINFLKSS